MFLLVYKNFVAIIIFAVQKFITINLNFIKNTKNSCFFRDFGGFREVPKNAKKCKKMLFFYRKKGVFFGILEGGA